MITQSINRCCHRRYCGSTQHKIKFDNCWCGNSLKGWRLESYVDPKGERSIDNLKASITGAGGYVLPGSNDYKAILAHNGASTFEEVPAD